MIRSILYSLEIREGAVTIQGKGPRSECSSYRPITLLSVPGKVFAHVLLARHDPLLQKHCRPHQSGFTRCRSTLDAILALRLLTEIHTEFWQPLHVAFVGLKAAFDSVDRNALWKAMRGIGVPPILMDLIIDLHTATSARVRLAGPLSTPFITTSGVRQGCVLDPALFCRAIDFITEHASRKVGIQVDQHTFTDIGYADDVALLVDKEESLRAALVSMDEEASKFGLRVSWTKTKIQNLGSGRTPSPIIVDGNTVDPVEEFIYLGSIQSSKCNSRPEYIRRIGLAANALKRLDCVWSQSKLSITMNLRIYSTYPYYCMALRPGPSYKPTGINWILSMYDANDATCTSDGTDSYPTTKSCIVPACSTSRWWWWFISPLHIVVNWKVFKHDFCCFSADCYLCKLQAGIAIMQVSYFIESMLHLLVRVIVILS